MTARRGPAGGAGDAAGLGGGGQIDYNRLATLAELIRPTVKSYLEALEVAHAVHILRPFCGGGSGEIVSRPKCYAFDTGFVTYEKGWSRIREDDRGLLWEYLVLDALRLYFTVGGLRNLAPRAAE